jgi:aldehyde dehydrogenase (NAD+)
MGDTEAGIIIEKLANQRSFFSTHKTKDSCFRIRKLRKLKMAILQSQDKIEAALWSDLNKSPEEAYLTEISIVINEIDYHIKHLKQWTSPKKVTTPLHLFPSSSKLLFELLGIALIVAPWNYPFHLLIHTLIGAISAGCCSLLKPSPDAPRVAILMEQLISANFEANYISIIQGGRKTNTILFSLRFDIIFFTGSPKVGKVVMKAAAENLTPVILELGGKSPCIVDADADLGLAAKRIIWGKLINAGQTCIAPDYLFAHQSIKKELLDKMAEQIILMYGSLIKQNRLYPRIINEQAVERLRGLLNEGEIHTGGEVDVKERFIAPTIIDAVTPDFLIMQEEIFGPILPVLGFEHIDTAIDHINKNEKPLALYYFGSTKKAKKVLSKTSSGGACINDTLMHISNHNLPFGGVGNSGIGNYHGYERFLAFSNKRGVVTTPTWVDIPLKYAPFRYFKWIQKII